MCHWHAFRRVSSCVLARAPDDCLSGPVISSPADILSLPQTRSATKPHRTPNHSPIQDSMRFRALWFLVALALLLLPPSRRSMGRPFEADEHLRSRIEQFHDSKGLTI